MKIHQFSSNAVTISIKDCRYIIFSLRTHMVQVFTLFRNALRATEQPLNCYSFLLYVLEPSVSLHVKFQEALFPHPSLLPLHLLHLHNQIRWGDPVAETLSIKGRKKKIE